MAQMELEGKYVSVMAIEALVEKKLKCRLTADLQVKSKVITVGQIPFTYSNSYIELL